MSFIHVVRIEASPDPDSAETCGYGGAFINVFTTDAPEARALETAQREVAEARWLVKLVESVTRVTSSDYSADDPGREYVEQALIDGTTLVIHSFPPEPDIEVH